jgi:serine phosphatase RsbU (regulator of sigma subunit)
MVSSGRSGSVGGGAHGVSRPVAQQARELLADVAALATDVVADCTGVGVSVVIEGEVHTVAATRDSARRIDEAQYGSGDGPCLAALRLGQEVACDDYASDRRWPEVAREARFAGVSSSLSVPLHTGNGVVGALNLSATRPHAFPADRRRSAQTLARHGGMILHELQQRHEDQARRAAEHRVIEALQRSLSPDLPTLPGVACAARHLAGTHGEGVDGEWHDLFALPDGAIGIVIGDAAGHAAVAAATMGQLRSVLRSYAYERVSPSLVLDRMDRVVGGFRLAQQSTVFYGRLVSDAAGALLLYGNADHPPPILRYPGGTVTRLAGAVSTPIGLPTPGYRPRSEAAIDLPVGSTLLLYTSGLLNSLAEGRDSPHDAIDTLVRAAADLPGPADPSSMCQSLLEALVPAEHHRDITLMAVQITGRAQPGSSPPDAGISTPTRPAEHARRLAHLLAQAERDSRHLWAELKHGRSDQVVGDEVVDRAERCHLLVQDALSCGALKLAALLSVPGDQLPS